MSCAGGVRCVSQHHTPVHCQVKLSRCPNTNERPLPRHSSSVHREHDHPPWSRAAAARTNTRRGRGAPPRPPSSPATSVFLALNSILFYWTIRRRSPPRVLWGGARTMPPPSSARRLRSCWRGPVAAQRRAALRQRQRQCRVVLPLRASEADEMVDEKTGRGERCDGARGGRRREDKGSGCGEEPRREAIDCQGAGKEEQKAFPKVDCGKQGRAGPYSFLS